MRSGLLVKTAMVMGAGSIVSGMISAPTAHSAEPPKAIAKTEAPDGYVLVSQEGLRQLVHDEVARQLQEIVRRGEQQRAAQARIQSISTAPLTASSQIALYRLQHRDAIPTIAQLGDGFEFLTFTTDAAGHKSSAEDAFGPYLQHKLVNPITGKTKIAPMGKATLNDGWSYDEQIGKVKIVLPQQLESQLQGRVDFRVVEFAATD